MKPECRFCGYCQENKKKQGGLNVQGGQWLEALEDMMEEAVASIREAQPDLAGCNGRVAARFPS